MEIPVAAAAVERFSIFDFRFSSSVGRADVADRRRRKQLVDPKSVYVRVCVCVCVEEAR